MTEAPRKATTRTWVGLAVLVLPMLLIAIDGMVLIFAPADITAELEPSGTQQLWILDIYALMLAGLLITMSSLGDRFGRRKLLLIGAVFFAIASVMGALATQPWMLIAARALLGVSGAAIMPGTLSLIRNMFLDRDCAVRGAGRRAQCGEGDARLGAAVRAGTPGHHRGSPCHRGDRVLHHGARLDRWDRGADPARSLGLRRPHAARCLRPGRPREHRALSPPCRPAAAFAAAGRQTGSPEGSPCAWHLHCRPFEPQLG